MKRIFEKAVFMLVMLASITMVSCSNDDFTNPKELIKGAWTAHYDTGWRTLEFNGDHWNGTYYFPETGTVYASGEYKWEKDDEFIRLTGQTSKGRDFFLIIRYKWCTTQELLIEGVPTNSSRGFLFKRFVR